MKEFALAKEHQRVDTMEKESKMQIVIPTYRRANIQRTFQCLPQKWKDRTTFVCDQEDMDKLKFKYGSTSKAQYVLTPDHVKTIAQKRAWIIKSFPYEKILMMDDDLRIDVRIPNTQKLLVAKPEQVDEHMVKVEAMLDKYRHIGISPRQGNNRLMDEWVPNTRIMYALAYHLPTVRDNCELGRIETREDFDYNLQLLRKGFENRVYSWMTVGQDQYNAPGGASTERTIQSSNEDAEKLAALHPGFVKVVDKEYSTSINRKEVVVYWKKAYESSQKEKIAC
jgi:hypothetical protein